MRCKSWLKIAMTFAVLVGAARFEGLGPMARAGEPRRLAAEPVPFTFAKPDKPLIILETMVNDKGPYRFVLDTGAGGTILSPALSKEIGIEPAKQDKTSKATGAGGDVQICLGKVKSLRIGQARVEGLDVAVMDLAGISKAIETDLDGIVGYNFLKRFRVTIDYRGQTVTFE